jgi:hypothetical protein
VIHQLASYLANYILCRPKVSMRGYRKFNNLY